MNVKNILVLSLIILSFCSCSKQNEEEIEDKTLTGASLLKRDSITPENGLFREIFFVSEMLGFATANNAGEILKTMDGGETWSSTYKDKNKQIGFLKFVNEDVGIFMSYESKWEIYRSLDGGLNWQNLALPLSSAFFIHWDWVDDSTLVVSCSDENGSRFFQSDDIGESWHESIYEDNFPYSEIYYIDMVDDKNGIALGSHDAWSTDNAGISWSQIIQSNDVREVDFYSKDKGVVTGSSSVKSTSDGAQSWQEVAFKFDDQIVDHLNAPFYLNQEEIFFASREGIYKSNNGGVNMKRINDLIDQNKFYRILDLFMIDQNIGYAVGEEHFDDTLQSKSGHTVILKTTTGWE